MIFRNANGIWRCCGSRYEILSSYIQGLAATEQTDPGSYRHLIQSYREHLKAARKVNPSTVTVQTDKRLATVGVGDQEDPGGRDTSGRHLGW